MAKRYLLYPFCFLFLALGCGPQAGDEGQPCKEVGAYTSSTTCGKGLYCNRALKPAVCQKANTVKAGEACWDDDACAVGLLCDAARCVATGSLAEDAACARDEACASGRCLTSPGNDTRKCYRRRAEGEACGESCAEGLSCEAGVCSKGP